MAQKSKRWNMGAKREKLATEIIREKANLLLITFYQWRGDWGDPTKPVVKLPRIEKIARDGWTAQYCYTSSPQCVPARLSWITGLHPSQLGVTKNQSADLPGNAPSFVRDLKNKGWETAIVGKTHWSDHSKKCDLRENTKRLEALGFDKSVEVAGPRALRIVSCNLTEEWKTSGFYELQMDDLDRRYKQGRTRSSWETRASILPNRLYPDIWIADEAIKMLMDMPKNEPWMLWVSFVGPHEPFDTPKPWKGNNKSRRLPKVIGNDEWIERLDESTELKKARNLWKGKLNEKEVEMLRCDYADHLQLLDEQVGKLVDKLAKRIDNVHTAVALTSDHGEMLGDHQMLYKSTFLEPSIRVPFIYRSPLTDGNFKSRKYKSCLKGLGLTELLKEVTINLNHGGSIKGIREWTKTQTKVIAEYGDEIMIIKKRIKIVFDKTGKALWASNIKKDQKEESNMLENKNLEENEKKIMNKIKQLAKKELEKRDDQEWRKIFV